MIHNNRWQQFKVIVSQCHSINILFYFIDHVIHSRTHARIKEVNTIVYFDFYFQFLFNVFSNNHVEIVAYVAYPIVVGSKSPSSNN